MEEEKILEEGNVLVTTRRYVCGAETHAIGGITSVSIGESSFDLKTLIICAIGGGIIGGIAGAALGGDASGVLFGLGLIGGAALYSFTYKRYFVRITSASGDRKTLEVRDQEQVKRVVNALNDAIIRHKG